MATPPPPTTKDPMVAIENEMAYQRQTAEKWNHQGAPTFESELLQAEHYLVLARTAWATSSGDQAADVLRKVLGIVARCVSNHGVPLRPVDHPRP